MAQTVPVTVSLPADLVKDVDRIAKEQKKPRSQVVAEALKRRTWLWRLDHMQAQARPHAERLGIRTEEDVERILKKHPPSNGASRTAPGTTPSVAS